MLMKALAPVDILRRAGLPVKTVGITGKTVCGSHGIPVTADIAPDEVTEKIDLLVLPGGMPGAANLDQSPVAEALLTPPVDGGIGIVPHGNDKLVFPLAVGGGQIHLKGSIAPLMPADRTAVQADKADLIHRAKL